MENQQHHQDAGVVAQPPPAYHQPPAGQPQQFAQQAPMNQQGANMMGGAVIPLEHLTDRPQHIDCPFCNQRTQTLVVHEGEGMQFLVGAALCLFCICLACLPCIGHWFEKTVWTCSNCKRVVATKTHDGPIQVFRPQEQVMVQSQYAQPQQFQQQQPYPQQPHPQQPHPQQPYPQQPYPQQPYPQQPYPQQPQPQQPYPEQSK